MELQNNITASETTIKNSINFYKRALTRAKKCVANAKTENEKELASLFLESSRRLVVEKKQLLKQEQANQVLKSKINASLLRKKNGFISAGIMETELNNLTK